MKDVKECKMPKLEINRKAVSLYWGARIIGSDIGNPAEMYRAIFIRLVDKALYEYVMARNAVLAQIKRKDIGHPLTTFIGGVPFYYVVIGNHLETCINATRRALRILKERMKDKKPPFFIDRIFRRNVERFFEGINCTRDSLEHIEDNIAESKIKKGQSYLPVISVDASEIEVGNQKLNLISLAEVISKLHKFALELAAYNAPGTEKWLSPKIIHSKDSRNDTQTSQIAQKMAEGEVRRDKFEPKRKM